MEDIFSIFVQLDVSPLSPQSCTNIKVENAGLFVCMHTVFEEEKECTKVLITMCQILMCLFRQMYY